jgi:cytochrome o ubiquinol oxidase subunit 1
MIIAIPTGVKVFNWLFTMFRGRVRFTTPMLWFMGFITTFTVGGATGVILAIPPADFQLHNSLFLVAHFHNMIIGGVVFGFFAGITYWWPKIFGFRLNETLGRYAFWCWLVGFLLAFVPLYILGLMGATRRMDHYDPSLGWQWLFIVAAIGAVVIAIGIGFQLLQFAYSIWQRKRTLEPGGDPWDGRTLEWATPSPVPVYNFAVTPQITTRDSFWEEKQNGTAHQRPDHYEDIELPKNTGIPVIIAGAAFVLGFAYIWHMWWLAALGAVAIVALIIYRANQEDTEYIIPAAEVARMEAKYYAQYDKKKVAA